MNAERILVASECVGDGRWFIRKGTAYANDRRVFDRSIGHVRRYGGILPSHDEIVAGGVGAPEAAPEGEAA